VNPRPSPLHEPGQRQRPVPCGRAGCQACGRCQPIDADSRVLHVCYRDPGGGLIPTIIGVCRPASPARSS